MHSITRFLSRSRCRSHWSGGDHGAHERARGVVRCSRRRLQRVHPVHAAQTRCAFAAASSSVSEALQSSWSAELLRTSRKGLEFQGHSSRVHRQRGKRISSVCRPMMRVLFYCSFVPSAPRRVTCFGLTVSLFVPGGVRARDSKFGRVLGVSVLPRCVRSGGRRVLLALIDGC